jgi:thymidylate synthase (FAD)
MTTLQKSDLVPPGAICLFGDQGFIARLDDNCAGDDLTIVNAARVSFGKRSTEMTEGNEKLLAYLAKNKHMSPFRHPQISFHLKAPEMMMRQAYKHVVGIDWTSSAPPTKDHAWNEISGRYVMYDDVYEPTEFRPQSESNKQGSEDGDLSNQRASDFARVKDFYDDPQQTVRDVYQRAIEYAKTAYHILVENGVAKEQARLVMPFATFTEVIWTCSLEAVVHFCKLRTHSHAQWEIREFADAVCKLTSERFPVSFNVLMENL